MILEGLVTTVDERGEVNLSPMGPRVNSAMERFELFPFQSSRTFANLRRDGEGVLHVTDDVLVLARAAIGVDSPAPEYLPASRVRPPILAEAARWYEFVVESIDDSKPRAVVACRTVARGVGRELFGLNRAQHAVIEAAILATRLGLLPRDKILDELERLAPLVDKTGGPREHLAFALLRHHIETAAVAPPS